MTEYTPRNGQELNTLLANAHMVMPHYSSSSGASYIYGNDQVPYANMNAVYPPYTATYSPNNTGAQFMPETSHMAVQYQQNSSHLDANLSQPRIISQTQCQPSRPSTQRYSYANRAALHQDSYSMVDTEDQDSVNRDTMLSEPVSPVLEGYPDVKEFDLLMRSYVHDLSPKKQDKALIHAKRAANIRTVLIDKKTTAIESAQFRFWVKKMFQLLPNDPKVPDWKKKICHEGKPVAVREKLFKILTIAHKQCQHGGRDKTSAQVRRIYSWVPKELISRFVKLCPTCRVRRGTARTSPSASDKGSPPDYMDTQSPPEMLSPPDSRGSSVVSRQCPLSSEPPFRQTSYSSAFQLQNRWMSSAPPTHAYSGAANMLIPAASHTLGSNVGPAVHYSTGNLQTIDGHHTVMRTSYLSNQADTRHQTY